MNALLGLTWVQFEPGIDTLEYAAAQYVGEEERGWCGGIDRQLQECQLAWGWIRSAPAKIPL